MSNLTLYQVSDQYLADLEKLNDLELDDQTFKDTLEGLTGDFELKATNVSMYYGNFWILFFSGSLWIDLQGDSGSHLELGSKGLWE